MVSEDGMAPNRMVGVFASVNRPLHHKVRKFSSGTGSPGGPGKGARCGMNTRNEFRNVSVTEADAARQADLNWKLQISNNQWKVHGRQNVAKVVRATSTSTGGFLVKVKGQKTKIALQATKPLTTKCNVTAAVPHTVSVIGAAAQHTTLLNEVTPTQAIEPAW